MCLSLKIWYCDIGWYHGAPDLSSIINLRYLPQEDSESNSSVLNVSSQFVFRLQGEVNSDSLSQSPETFLSDKNTPESRQDQRHKTVFISVTGHCWKTRFYSSDNLVIYLYIKEIKPPNNVKGFVVLNVPSSVLCISVQNCLVIGVLVSTQSSVKCDFCFGGIRNLIKRFPSEFISCTCWVGAAPLKSSLLLLKSWN